jgi:hypothetical protein
MPSNGSSVVNLLEQYCYNASTPIRVILDERMYFNDNIRIEVIKDYNIRIGIKDTTSICREFTYFVLEFMHKKSATNRRASLRTFRVITKEYRNKIGYP